MFGHHTGSFVAVDLAARHPERVKSLMLSAPTWVDGDMLKANPDGYAADVDSAQPTGGKPCRKAVAQSPAFLPGWPDGPAQRLSA